MQIARMSARRRKLVYKHLLAVRDTLSKFLVHTPRRAQCRRWAIQRVVESSESFVESDTYSRVGCLTASEDGDVIPGQYNIIQVLEGLSLGVCFC